MWSIHNAVVRATAEPKNDYDKLKKRINLATLGYGGALTSMYFITHGADQGVSSTIGVATSLAYINLLERHVDNIERSPFQKQLLAPIGTAIFETVWNSAPFAFDFDYGATFVGFLAYKVALLTVVYDEVRRMLISDDE
jgi:pimeloyl-ACP methyl ester carboxylesterase